MTLSYISLSEVTSLLWEAAVVAQYAATALLSGANAAYLLARRWPSRRLRLGAWTVALVSLGVAVQGTYVTLAILSQRSLDRADVRGWLLAGSLGLLGSLLVVLLIVRRHLRR